MHLFKKETDMRPHFLLFPAPTVVVNKSVTVFASLGNHPYLYCGVRYDKKVNVTYRWYFRGQQILRDDSRRSIDSEGRLTIRGVFQRDNGIYRCDSSSSVGDYSTTIELKVQGTFWFPAMISLSSRSERCYQIKLLYTMLDNSQYPHHVMQHQRF